MKLPVYLYGHPVLRKVCRPIDTAAAPEGLQQLIDDMFETMYASEGVGLAAPQVGRDMRLVVIDADQIKDDAPECAGVKLVLINPEIEILDGPVVTRGEGCLSLPGLSENVPRVEHIRLRYLDRDLQPRDEVYAGFASRIIQHECDHLQGQLYIDHINMLRKQLIKAKLNNIVTGKTRCDYPVKYAPKK